MVSVVSWLITTVDEGGVGRVWADLILVLVSDSDSDSVEDLAVILAGAIFGPGVGEVDMVVFC